jgi:biotin synthase
MSNLTKTWEKQQVSDIYNKSFMDLVFTAQTIHRENFDPNSLQLSTLCNVQSYGCPENCGYCAQSAHFKTNLKKEKILDTAEVIERAAQAKANGATRFCIAAAWRSPPAKDLPKVLDMIKGIKKLGLESCATLGMLSEENASQLKAAGLDYYNHNLDTSPEYYPEVVTTRTYQDRLDTLAKVSKNGMKTCCGGILGLGESREDRISLLHQLANLPDAPRSVPINMLVKIKGTPLGEGNAENLDKIELVRTIATARIILPKSVVRLTAGRAAMSDELQTLCFFAGANSIFLGEKLLTTPNTTVENDKNLMQRLGLKSMAAETELCC